MFDCGNGVLIPLDALCDGHDNCTSGSDENAVICDSKSFSECGEGVAYSLCMVSLE